MSEHCGYIVQIKELQKHPNADRLQIAIIFGNSVIVDLKTKIGDLGVFFPIDLQLSEEYCRENDLVRRKDENGNAAGGYLDPNKRNIRAMRFRGSPSEGLFLPLNTLAYTGKTQFEVGEKIDNINGHEICCKYIPRNSMHEPTRKLGNKARKKKVPIAPLFLEHADTEQLAYNLDAFRAGDLIEITLKMHGTSARTGYLPKLKKFKRSLWDIIRRKEGTPIYDWGYVTGTRRVVLNDFSGGFYGDNSFREPHAKFFEGKLNKGEEVFGEIVGFTDDGIPIMPNANNTKTYDKKFIKTYGQTTIFSYGCDSLKEPKSKFYVYRMTMTNEDGAIVEYPPDFVRYRCEQMGVEYVPVLWRGIIPPANADGLVRSDDFIADENGQFKEWIFKTPGEYIKDIAEQFYDGPDPIGKTHIREGVVVRIVNRPKFCAYKHKNWFFKCIEGIIKNEAIEPDREEKEDILEEV